MARPTRIHIDTNALLHNVEVIKRCAPGKKIIAMLKANAYGCGLESVWPTLSDQVDAFGVACIEEAEALRGLGYSGECILFQGVFSADELIRVANLHFQCVIHQINQLEWILATPLPSKIKVWVKVNTGMHRLGFEINDLNHVMTSLSTCSWIDDEIGLMTHLACADDPDNFSNQQQIAKFNELVFQDLNIVRSIANSAAILALPETHADVVRPGLLIYGASPFPEKIGVELGLKPVMCFVSRISAIHDYPAHVKIGYGGSWETLRPSKIGIVPVGYGDGYPRHIAENTPVWVNDLFVPIVGRVSMDMMTVDLTDCPSVNIGDSVELWGSHVAVETVAKSAGTIAYELLCQVSPRARLMAG